MSNPHETTILMSRYLELVAAEKKLNALDAAGIDNWEGYNHAIDILNGED